MRFREWRTFPRNAFALVIYFRSNPRLIHRQTWVQFAPQTTNVSAPAAVNQGSITEIM